MLLQQRCVRLCLERKISLSCNTNSVLGYFIFLLYCIKTIISLSQVGQELLLEYKGRRPPRSARRARKPLQENWIKAPGQGIWIKCTYDKCSFEWQYFGGHQWAECPICHSSMKVSIAKKNFIHNKYMKNQRDQKTRQQKFLLRNKK